MVSSQAEAHIDKYVAARRAMLKLWFSKRQLSQVAQACFPKSHPLFKTLFGLCHNDTTWKIRHLCDVAICRCADRFGDDMFRDHVVDDVCIPAVTHWYYGISHLLPHPLTESVGLGKNRTKELSLSDVELFEQVYQLGRKFIDSASLLQCLPTRQFNREAARFEKDFEQAREKLGRNCPMYSAYLQLQCQR